MKIKSIYIDGLHNAKDKTYTFGDIVYIFGNNGAGKSTILQAIQYALLGYIPGTAKNSKEALLRHSPKGEITVKLILDTVTIIRKVTSAGNKVVVDPADYDISTITKELELPIFNFNEFVGQTANKLKEYLIKTVLPTSNGELDWKQILTESILDCNFQDKDSIIEYGLSLVHNLDGDVLDQVITANAKFKEEQTYNKSELQRLQNTIDSLIYYDDYVGPTNLEELESKLLADGAIRDQLIRYESALNTFKGQRTGIEDLENRLATMGGKAEYDSANAKLVELKDMLAKQSAELDALKVRQATMQTTDSVTDSIINSKGICPFTKESCKSIMSKIEDIRKDAVTRKAEKLELAGEIEQKTIEFRNIETRIRALESTIADFNNIWGHIENLKKTLAYEPQKPDTDKTVFELDAEIKQLTDNKTKLLANIKYNDTIENLTKMKFEAELRGKALANWVKKTDTNGLQTTLMVTPFDELAKTMTNYITSMYGNDNLKAHFNVSTKANSFSFGLIRDDVYIPYDLLSSGEKCLYSLALMICIINNGKSPLKVMLCDDMFDHLDNQAIENTFEALKTYNKASDNPIQFIFAGVKDCKNAEDTMLRIG